MSSNETVSQASRIRLLSIVLPLFLAAGMSAYGQNHRCPKDESGAITAAESGFGSVGMRGEPSTLVSYCAITLRADDELGYPLSDGNIWPRADALAPILLTKSDITIGNLFVPAGKYSLRFLPSEYAWTLIVSKQVAMSEYDEKNDLGRVTMTKAPEQGQMADKLSIILGPMLRKTCSKPCDSKEDLHIPAKELKQPQLHIVWGSNNVYATIRPANKTENAFVQ